jgi:hypothetical protein
MKWNALTTTLVVLGTAFAAWLVVDAMSGSRDAALRSAAPAAPADVRADALAHEIARLHERLAPSAAPLQAGRNLFQFTAANPRHEAPAGKPALSEAAPVAPLPSPPPPFKLIGVAEDKDGSATVRTAIVSSPGQLFTVKQGQNVTPRFLVTRIGADTVELQDLVDHSTLRLALK